MTGDTRPDLAPLPPLPSAADIVRYMRATGWAHGRQGSHGAMWTRGDVEFSVPHEDHNPAWLREVIARLASAEGRTPEATTAAIAVYRDKAAMADEDLPAPARRAAEAAYRGWRIGNDGEGRLHAALVAAAPLIRADAEAKLAAQREYDTYRRALWAMVRQFGGSVFLTSVQMEDVPLLASLGIGREPGGIRINAGEEP